MHSPFVFDFILHVLNNKKHYQAPVEIEQLRKQLLRDQRMIEVNDLGAGSRKRSAQQKTIAQIAGSAPKPPKYAQLLFRLVKHYQPQSIIELGTSLGLTTAYLSNVNEAATIKTIEGSPAIMNIAKENLSVLGCRNVNFFEGNFDQVLPQLLKETKQVDLAYIDGNHRYAPTMQYFHELLPKVHADSILVFDDIHWSAEMEKAWAEIRQHPAVQYSIDIFFLGFVFFRSEFKIKQDFIIKF